MNRRNKYVHVSNKFYKHPEQKIYTYQTNYMNRWNKYVYVSSKLYNFQTKTFVHTEQILWTTETNMCTC
jgi:hypothetical protein